MSVPTDRQTLSMHRYLQLQGVRCSVGTPLIGNGQGIPVEREMVTEKHHFNTYTVDIYIIYICSRHQSRAPNTRGIGNNCSRGGGGGRFKCYFSKNLHLSIF